MTTSPLILGPMMRYVDESSASIWFETRESARVVVAAGGRSWSARTFAVHGHHYALVEVSGLEPGTVTPYSVQIDGTEVWPDPDSSFPASVIATLEDRPAAAAVIRVLPHERAARRNGQSHARRRCAEGLRAPVGVD